VFKKFPSINRLTGPVIVTEKLDGTNACVVIEETISGFNVMAQSRTRMITPEKDNFGFARWVWDHGGELIQLLGPGYHYGEWWGCGIQRGYGIKTKVFSLFNTHRWNNIEFETACIDYDMDTQLGVVPVLWTGAFDTEEFNKVLFNLSISGSIAAPGYAFPEGIVVYDTRSGVSFKKTYDYDDTGKGVNR